MTRCAIHGDEACDLDCPMPPAMTRLDIYERTRVAYDEGYAAAKRAAAQRPAPCHHGCDLCRTLDEMAADAQPAPDLLRDDDLTPYAGMTVDEVFGPVTSDFLAGVPFTHNGQHRPEVCAECAHLAQPAPDALRAAYRDDPVGTFNDIVAVLNEHGWDARPVAPVALEDKP